MQVLFGLVPDELLRALARLGSQPLVHSSFSGFPRGTWRELTYLPVQGAIRRAVRAPSCTAGKPPHNNSGGNIRTRRRQTCAFEALVNSGDRWRQSLRTRPHDLSVPLQELVQSAPGS